MDKNNCAIGSRVCSACASKDGCVHRDTISLNRGLYAKELWRRFGLMLELTGAEYATVTSGGEAAHALIREKIELGEFALNGESYFPAMETSQPDKWPVKEDILLDF